MKTLLSSKSGRYPGIYTLIAAALLFFPVGLIQAAEIFWTGGTASYTNTANWTGGIIPGVGDHGIVSNGVVQINVGDPDWTITDLSTGSTNGLGTVEQNGQTLSLASWLHIADGQDGIGVFTLNGGTVMVTNGRLFLCEAPNTTGTLNINGGAIYKTGGDAIVVADGGWNGQASRTGTVNQVAGTVNSSSEIWIGQSGDGVGIGSGIWNLHAGGTINVSNWVAIGRSGGNGLMTMDGGAFNKYGGGSFLVGTGFSTPAGGSGVGQLDHSGGLINIQGGELLIPENAPSSGTYNMNGTATLVVNSWIAVGRGGAPGTLNLTNGSITKTGGGNIVIGAGSGSVGNLNQFGGTVTNTTSQVWLGENGSGTWNLNGGSAVFGVVHIAQTASSIGTLNVNGGTMAASEITSGDPVGFSTLSLNGGTIQPTADNNNFLHDLGQALVGNGGAIFDSQGFNITINQSLQNNGSGGVTKNGAGTLTLGGINTYAGATTVNGGKLAITTDGAGGGDYVVANGATLGVKVQFLGAQLNTPNLTLASSTAASLDADLGAFGNPTAAPINVSGTLAVNGTITVNIADGNPQVGQFPLIDYVTRTGNGSFVLGTLPLGMVATIVTNGPNSSIDINIVSVNLSRWDGQAGGTWDIGLTTNFVNFGTGFPVFYADGNSVQFDDNALGTTTVNLVTNVNPASLTVNNTSLPYTLVGTGKIGGATKFTKQGLNTFTVANSTQNTYTGATVIVGGTLSVTNLANGGTASAVGASSASPTNLVLQNGALSYSGPAVSINRGYSLQGTNGILDVQNNLALSGSVATILGAGFTKTGPAQLTYLGSGSNALTGGSSSGYGLQNGTVLFDGSAGNQTNTILGQLRVGDAFVAANAAITITNSRLDVTGNMELGNSSGATSTLTLNNNGILTVRGNPFAVGRGTSTGVVVQNGGIMDSRNELWVGQGVNGFGSYTITNGALTISNWFALGRQNGSGVMTMTGGTITKASGGNFIIGTGAGNNANSGTGLFNFSGGTINCFNEYWLAENTLARGTNNMSGSAVLNLNNWMSIGRGGIGVFSFTGGTINKTGGGNFIVGDGGTGYFTQIAGTTLNINSELWIGQGGAGVGQYDFSGGTITVGSWVAIGRGGNGVLNMSGGTLTKNGGTGNHFIVGSGVSGVINQTGGLLTNTIGDFWLAENNAGTWNMSGTAQGVVDVLRFAINASGRATLNLNAGATLTASQFAIGNVAGLSTNNMNGGTIRARTSNAAFMQGLTAAYILSGGVTIDSDVNTIGIAQPLLDGTGGGGLTKIGSGTLRLNGVNTYTGSTLVNNGTLGGSGTIAGPVSVASGASLAPGNSIGTLTISNSLSLASGSSTVVEFSFDGGVTNNDFVTGVGAINYSGALVATNAGSTPLAGTKVIKLFNAVGPIAGNFSSVTILPAGTANGTFNPATGELTIVAIPPFVVNPVFVSGGNLILTGSGGNPNGPYTWLTSTNVAAPLSTWLTNSTGTFSGTGTFSNAIPVNPTERARFFQLRQP